MTNSDMRDSAGMQMARASSRSRLVAAFMLGLALVLITPRSARAEFAGGIYIDALCDLYYLLNHEMGGFFFTAALMVGLIGAAFGSLQQVKAAVVVGVGCVSISAVVTMHSAFRHYDCGDDDEVQDGGGAPRTVNPQQQLLKDSGSPVAFNPAFAGPESNDE